MGQTASGESIRRRAPARRRTRLCAILAALALAAGGCTLGTDEEPTPSNSSTLTPFPDPSSEAVSYKPVLYLYPQEQAEVGVDLDYSGELTFTYPQADAEDSWQVTARPDGTLVDGQGRQYPYLFWEGVTPHAYAQDEGFVVAGDEAVPFLEEKLAALGLTDEEAADFISFWGPRLAANDYNLVTFATEQYTADARYEFTDANGQAFTPDTFIRVYMVHSPTDASVDVPEQELPAAPERHGFVAVEWGGSSLSG